MKMDPFVSFWNVDISVDFVTRENEHVISHLKLIVPKKHVSKTEVCV